MDDYSANTTEMRAVADPYPASAESLATSLQGEIERLRYQHLQAINAINGGANSYWYQDAPTAGVFSIVGSSVGINDTTPDFSLDVGAGTLGIDGTITTTGDDVDIATHTTIAGDLVVTGNISATGVSFVLGTTGTFTAAAANASIITFSETVDTLSEFNGSTFTALATGYYHTCLSGQLSENGGSNSRYRFIAILKNDGALALGDPNIVTSSGEESPTDNTQGYQYLSACTYVSLTAGNTLTPCLYNDTVAGQFLYGTFSVRRIQ